MCNDISGLYIVMSDNAELSHNQDVIGQYYWPIIYAREGGVVWLLE